MRLLWALFALAVYTAPAFAGERYLATGETAVPPRGWVAFCERLPKECVTHDRPVEWVDLRGHRLRDLLDINLRVNLQIKEVSDLEHYGVPEYWAYPDDGIGDCEDIALLKKRLLIQKGWPASTLLMTVVVAKNGDGHAVLMVRTSAGDFILDNQTNMVWRWDKTDFKRYFKRQSQADPNRWVSTDAAAPIVVSLRSHW